MNIGNNVDYLSVDDKHQVIPYVHDPRHEGHRHRDYSQKMPP